MTRYFLTLFACGVLTSCGKPSAPANITVSVGSDLLLTIDYEIE